MIATNNHWKAVMAENNLTHVTEESPSQLIRDYLQVKPAASPADIVLWLQRFGIEISVEAAAAKLAAIKTG